MSVTRSPEGPTTARPTVRPRSTATGPDRRRPEPRGPATRPPRPRRPGSTLRRWWLASSLAYLAATTALAAVATARNDGHFVFGLDDPYIHASIARNLVEHGVWGVTPLHYGSASSSPAWTLLVAGAGALGVDVVASALIANMVFGCLLCGVFLLATGLHRDGGPAAAVFVALLVATGLAPITLMGMEPIMFAASVLALLVAAERCATPGRAGRRWWAVLVVAGLVTGGGRYESMWVAVGIVVGFGLSAWRGRRTVSAVEPTIRFRRSLVVASVVAVTTALPIVTMGLVNLGQGEHFLPNSVEAKSTLQTGVVRSLLSIYRLDTTLARVAGDPLLTLAAAVAVGALVAGLRRGMPSLLLPSLMLLTPWAGMLLFGDTSLARYTLFLIVLGAVIAVRLARLVPFPTRRTALAALAGAVLVLSIPGVRLVLWAPRAAHEVYRQQHQMARFIERFYDRDGIAVNDLGAVSLGHDGDVLDLLGLGSFDVLVQRKLGTFRRPAMTALAQQHGVKVVVIYRHFFRDLPDDWMPVESWCFAKPFTWSVGGSCVMWLGVGELNTAELRRNLSTFRPQLPGGIVTAPLDADGVPLPVRTTTD